MTTFDPQPAASFLDEEGWVPPPPPATFLPRPAELAEPDDAAFWQAFDRVLVVLLVGALACVVAWRWL